MTVAIPSRRPGLHRHARGMAVGFGLGLVSNAFAAPWSDADARVYLGILLAAIGAVYVGFAIADGRPSAIAVQAISAIVFRSSSAGSEREFSAPQTVPRRHEYPLRLS